MPPQVHFIQTNFTAGEISPFMFGRIDFDKYRNALALCDNFHIYQQGPLVRRSGTRFVKEVKNSAQFTSLIDFYISESDSYLLEFGDLYFRVFKDGAWVSGAGDVVTNIPTGEIPLIDFDQSSDILYITTGTKPSLLITSDSDTVWTVANFTALDGPYLEENGNSAEAITVHSGGFTSGGTADISIAGTGDLFHSTDNGTDDSNRRHFRLRGNSDRIIWGRITAVTNSRRVTVQWVGGDFTAFGVIAGVNDFLWRLGEFSLLRGFPKKVAFFEERIVFGNTASSPDGVWMSKAKDYTVFSPTEYDAEVIDSNAITISLPSVRLNEITSLVNSSGNILASTLSNEWIIESRQGPLTPMNINVERASTTGSRQNTKAVKIDQSVFFLQRSGRQLIEYGYSYENESYNPENTNLLAEHILQEKGSLGDWIDYQQIPNKVIWVVRDDGVLCSLTYNRAQSVYAWGRHIIADGEVEDISIIPATTQKNDRIYMIVKRTINSVTRRYIEYMEADFIPEHDQDKDDMFFVDSGITVTGTAMTTVGGLSHLEGKTVSVVTDGSVHPNRVVSSGSILLDAPADRVHVGLPYESRIRMLELEGGKEHGTAQGKIKRITHFSIRLFASLGFNYNVKGRQKILHSFRSSSGAMDISPALYTGDIRIPVPAGYETNGCIEISQDQPYPLNILAIMPEVTMQQ